MKMKKLLLFVFALCFSASMIAQETVPFVNAPSQAAVGTVTYNMTLTGGYTLGTIDWDGFASTINSGTYGSELTCLITGPGTFGSATVTLGSGTTYAPGANFVGSTAFFDGLGDPAGTWVFDFYETYDDGGDGLPDANWDNIDFDFNAYVPPAGVIAPWAEPFTATSAPAEWTMSGPETWLFSTGAAYGAGAAGDHTTGGGTNYAWVDGSGSGTNTGITLVTPLIDPTALTLPEFTFWWFSNNTNIPGDNNTLYCDMSTDGGGWTLIATLSGDNADWQKFAYDIPTTATTVQFRFVVDEDASTAYYNDMLIDDVAVDEKPTTPIITVTPDPYDYNYVQVGNTASQTFTVTNTGGGTGTILAAALAGDPEFVVATTSGIPGTVPPDVVTVTVDFTPSAVATFSTVLRVIHDGGTVDVPLSGEGVAVIPNDDCANAISVGPTYPETVMGTTKGAEIDCPGVLDWGAVWYEVTLPYTLNDLSASYCGTATPPMYTGGIVYYADCSDCNAYTIADAYAFDPCTAPDDATLQMSFDAIPGPGTIMFPAYAADDQDNGVDFTLTFDVIDASVVLPGTNCAVPIVVGALPYMTTDNTNLYGDDYSSADEICSSSSYLNGDDVVYAYTPAVDECIDITLTNTGTWVGLFVYEGCAPFTACVGVDTQSGGNPSLTNLNLIAGTTYYIVISTWPSPQNTTYDMAITACAPPVPGDDCTNPIYAVQGLNNAPQQPVWYEYTTTTTGLLEISSYGANVDTRLYVYSDCALTAVDDDDDYWGYPPGESWVGIPVTPGETYHILWGDNYGTAPFTFSLIETSTATSWTGAVDNDWWNAGNWSSGIPGINTAVTVPVGLTNNPTVGYYAVCGDIFLGSDASGTATLVDDSYLLVNGTATVQRYYPTGAPTFDEWHLISAPISDAEVGTYDSFYLQWYEEGIDGWHDITIPITDPMTSLQGFAFYAPTDMMTFDYMGTLGDGNYGIPISAYGPDPLHWNLFGNPYPSCLDWDLVAPANIANLWTGAVYYLDQATGNYVSYNGGMGGGVRYVPPGQGFFVSCANDGALFTVDNSMRTHTGSGTYYKSEFDNLLVLEATGNELTDATYLRFDESASEEVDQMDAFKLLTVSNPNLPQLYTLAGEKMSINVLPETTMVPAGFTAGVDGTYTISIKEVDGMANVVLEDLLTNTQTDLMNSPYTFNYNIDDQDNRFIIHFTPLGIGNNAADLINIYSSEKDVYVTVPANTKGDIYVYNIVGQEVASAPITDVVNKITLSNSANYVVKVVSDGEMVTRKVFVK